MAFSADNNYPIRSSWILDGGSNLHVCNQTIVHYLHQDQDNMGDTILANTRRVQIEYYSMIVINISTPTGPGIMTLTNVIYVPGFMTNIVSQSILKAKKLCYDR